MKTILIPIDFSEDSLNALEHAIFIANQLKANLRMMHVKVCEEFITPKYFAEVFNDHNRSVEDCFNFLLEKYTSKYTGGGKIDYVVSSGKVYKAVLNQAKEDNAYLIMMGTHGVSGFEEYWVGSNAYRVVTLSKYPVLTVRHGYMKKEIERIVMPIDAKKNSRVKVPLVTELAKAMNSEVIVIGVRESSRIDIVHKIKTYVEQTVQYMQEKGVKVSGNELHCKNISEDTLTFASQNSADLITIMSDYDENPMNIRIGTSAQQMVNHSPIPVLCVPPK
jgi:nucleotide-binding universal stress UspA family protein